MRRLFLLSTSAVLALGLSACATTSEPPAPVRPLVGPNEQVVETNFTPALECLSEHVRAQSYPAPRIAVGHITDLTGATDYFAGRRITQGAALMAMTALADSGMRVIERYDMGVIEVELNYAQNGLVRDSEQTLREVQAGQLQGADLYIVGGITEFNPNIRSSAAELSIDGLGDEDGIGIIGGNSYTIDVGIDLRLVDVRSSEVLSVRSFRKQVIGRERSAGIFEFVGGNIVDFNAGQRALEPVQTAVRTMIDRAVFEFVGALYNVDQRSCLDAASDHAVQASGMRRRGGDSEVLLASNTVAAPVLPASPVPPAPQSQAAQAPQPGPDALIKAPVAPAAGLMTVEPSLPTPPDGVVSVHLSSHEDPWAALSAWEEITGQAGPVLEGYRHYIHEIPMEEGPSSYRLLAGPAPNVRMALRLCERLAVQGQYCTPYDVAQENRRASVRTRLR